MMALKRLVARILLTLPGGGRLLAALRRLMRGGPVPLEAAGDAETVAFAIRLPEGRQVPYGYEGFTSISATSGFSGLIYEPDQTNPMLRAGHLRNMLLAAEVNGLDTVLASHTLDDPPALRCLPAPNSMIRRQGGPPNAAAGRVLRMLPPPDEGALDMSFAKLFAGAAVTHPAGAVADFRLGDAVPRAAYTGAWNPTPLTRDRPVVLVLPIFLAVGGVERNTIEIIRALKKAYHFVVVTTERLHKDQGSLHHQMAEVAEVIYDLSEIAENRHHLALLHHLRDGYHPDLVWICNGSPWLADNAGELRRLFKDIPIVDQQVYDTNEGWIQRYGESGIQSFDRFIAINSRIRDVFTDRLKMRPEAIDLIYSAIDAPRFDKPVPNPEERTALARSHGLPDDKPCFAFIGRLVEQKNPVAFLTLAQRSSAAGKNDHFVLVGDGALGEICDAFIREHALANVTRIPFCDDLTRLYPVLAGLIVSSRYEGLPIAMLEAMAMGVPVYATDVGDIGPVLADYESGTVSGDIAGGRGFLDGFLEWRERLGEFTEAAAAAAPLVRGRFSVTAIAKTYEECWQKAWRQRGRDV